MEVGKTSFGPAYRGLTEHSGTQSKASKKQSTVYRGLGRCIFLLSVFLLSSCSVTKSVRKKTPPQTPSNTVKPKEVAKVTPTPLPPQPVKKSLTTAEKVNLYLVKFGAVAQAEMKTYKIPASITLAQGLLESGFGEGRLAVEGNNHFGIKCHKDWNGERIYHDDDEKGECFRVYQDAATSYRDHSLFLSERQRYAFLFKLKEKDYKAWAKGLKKAGYATDPKYPDKLIRLIERFELNRFDGKEEVVVELSPAPQPQDGTANVYYVQKGDTLYSIAKKLQVPLEDLRTKNSLKDNTIYIGQALHLPQ